MDRSENSCYARGRDPPRLRHAWPRPRWIYRSGEANRIPQDDARSDLAWAGVKPKPAMSDPKSSGRNSPLQRVGVFDQMEVDSAVERWLASEVLSERLATQARQRNRSHFWYLLTKSGVELPPKPDRKKWWRIPTTTIDRAMEIMASRESVVVAAARFEMKATTLRVWLEGGERAPGSRLLLLVCRSGRDRPRRH